MASSPPTSPRRQSEMSSLRGAEPKRKPRGKPKRAPSPDRTLPFFQQDEFSDVTIKVGDKQLYSNRCLLSYSSPVFMKLLGDDSPGKGKTKSAASKDLDLSEKKFEDVCDLMSFIDPRVTKDLTDEEAMNLIFLAEEYDIAGLKKSCAWTITESFYKKRKGRRCGSVPTDETIRYLILADKSGLTDLKCMCIDELVANDNPFSCKMVSEKEELSEHVKRQVLEKKLDRVNLALARERRLRTETNQSTDTRGSKIWKK